MRAWFIVAVVFLALGCLNPVFAAAAVKETAAPKPSANKGKLGQYKADTSIPGYKYGVYVPKSYSETNPAGLFIHFRGQGQCGAEPHFHLWDDKFLEAHNLIGILMQYDDKDNMTNTAGKVQTAQEAIQQVIADYKILVGRGVISSYSGGGGPHALFNNRYFKTRGNQWPFSHWAIYGSNYHGNIVPNKACPMSWFVAFGEKEYSMAGIGPTALAQFGNVLGDGVRGGNPDAYLNVLPGKGHSIEVDDVEKSARAFRRGDLAFAPVLYEDDYKDADLWPIVQAANKQQIGDAMTGVNALLANAKASAEVKTKAQGIKAILEKRAKTLLEVGKEIAATDAVLANFYGKNYVKQLGSLPEGKELSQALSAAFTKPEFAKALTYHPQFEKNFRKIFSKGPIPDAAQRPFLEEMLAACGEKSLLGGMAADFLKLK